MPISRCTRVTISGLISPALTFCVPFNFSLLFGTVIRLILHKAIFRAAGFHAMVRPDWRISLQFGVTLVHRTPEILGFMSINQFCNDPADWLMFLLGPCSQLGMRVFVDSQEL